VLLLYWFSVGFPYKLVNSLLLNEKAEAPFKKKHYLMYVCQSLSIMSFVNIFMRVFGWCTKVTTIPPHFLAKICMSTQSESGHTK
jgi:hypothetical protein